MGFFSWIDVNNKENITDMDKEVTLLIPEKYMEATQEFIDGNVYWRDPSKEPQI